MFKLTLGTPEEHVPSKYCKGFHYVESAVSFPTDKIEFRKNARGCVVSFPLEDDAEVYGLGLQLKQFAHRGKKLKMTVNADPAMPTGDSHAPVPFFVTNKGWGIYVDTARYAEFYCGTVLNPAFFGGSALKPAETGSNTPALSGDELYATRKQSGLTMTIQIPDVDGVDLYIIEGDTITDIVSQYNMLSGGGCDVPEWGLGVLYRCFCKYTDQQVIALADEFIEKDIPLHIIGLEPGWQTHTYACSYIWSDRFPDPAGFVSEIRKRDLHVNLWQHAFTHPTAPIYDQIAPYCADTMVWGGVVPDFATEEGRAIFRDYQKKALVDIGVDGFKLDECDSSDNTGSWSFPLSARFPSGMDGEQYHSLFGTLYAQVMSEALGQTPTLSEIRNMGALAASYPYVLYSDLYDHKDFIRGMTTSAFSGLLWTPELRDARTADELIRRLQAVVFSVQCLINAWYCPDVPWRELGCEDEVRKLLKLRVTLMPRLKEAFRLYKETGKPPVRAMVMDYTADPEVREMDDQYLFCEDLLVAPIAANTGDTRRVYIPAGEWEDFFTGEAVTPGWHEVTTKGIPVYRKK